MARRRHRSISDEWGRDAENPKDTPKADRGKRAAARPRWWWCRRQGWNQHVLGNNSRDKHCRNRSAEKEGQRSVTGFPFRSCWLALRKAGLGWAGLPLRPSTATWVSGSVFPILRSRSVKRLAPLSRSSREPISDGQRHEGRDRHYQCRERSAVGFPSLLTACSAVQCRQQGKAREAWYMGEDML